MKKIVFLISLFLLTCSYVIDDVNHHRINLGLVFSYKPEKSFVDSLKNKIHEIYSNVNRIDVIKEDYLAEQSEINTDSVLEQLRSFLDKKHNRIIALTNKTIYYSDDYGFNNYPVGFSAHFTGIVSDLWVRDSSQHNTYFMNVVLHELGHIYGLAHCPNTHCLMIAKDHFDANTLCNLCNEKLKAFEKYD